MKRDNANVNSDNAMGTMLKYGSEGAKEFFINYILKPEHAKAHVDGDIHIHDLDFLTMTTTCCQIDLIKLFSGGFSTGHGVLREPNDISSYSALACIAIPVSYTHLDVYKRQTPSLSPSSNLGSFLLPSSVLSSVDSSYKTVKPANLTVCPEALKIYFPAFISACMVS